MLIKSSETGQIKMTKHFFFMMVICLAFMETFSYLWMISDTLIVDTSSKKQLEILKGLWVAQAAVIF